MSISTFEKAALLLKSYKIKLVVLLFLVFFLDQLVTPSVWNFLEHLIERKKSFRTHLWVMFVNQVWSFSFIGLIIWFDWKTHHNEMTMWFPKGRYSKLVATFLTLFWTRSLNQKNLKWNCFALICSVLLISKMYIKKYILSWLNKIMLGSPCTNF